MSVPHPEWLISNRRKWEEVEVDSKQATGGGLKEEIFCEPMMVNVKQELVFHAEPGHCTSRHKASSLCGAARRASTPSSLCQGANLRRFGCSKETA